MSVLTSAPISALAIELLRRSIVLPGTVARVPGTDYDGPSGGTVTIRVPQPRTALEQTTPGDVITFAAVDEVPVNVTMRHFYDATRVSDEDLSMSIQDFGRQILRPQMVAIAEAAEGVLAEAMNALTPDAGLAWTAGDPAANEDTVLAIREQLTDNKVPAGDRYCAVAPDVATLLLKIEKFVKANERGSSTALEKAILGELYGITFVESHAIDAGSAVAYHATGFGFGIRAPMLPPGNVDASVANEHGLALRSVVGFDTSRLSTACVTSTFAGAAVVPDDDIGTILRAIKVDTAP